MKGHFKMVPVGILASLRYHRVEAEHFWRLMDRARANGNNFAAGIYMDCHSTHNIAIQYAMKALINPGYKPPALVRETRMGSMQMSYAERILSEERLRFSNDGLYD